MNVRMFANVGCACMVVSFLWAPIVFCFVCYYLCELVCEDLLVHHQSSPRVGMIEKWTVNSYYWGFQISILSSKKSGGVVVPAYEVWMRRPVQQYHAYNRPTTVGRPPGRKSNRQGRQRTTQSRLYHCP